MSAVRLHTHLMTTMTTTDPAATAHGFWENAFAEQKYARIDERYYESKGGKTQREFIDRIGDVAGLRVLDVGCGRGELSTFLASKGAIVTATDYAQNAIDRTEGLARFNEVGDRVRGVVCDGLELGDLGEEFDLIVGRFVLHHIEPFDQFADVLKACLRPGGRAVFMENNSRNPLLMFARKNLAGRMGIPKFGDDEEYPLEPREIDMLTHRFAQVNLHYPELVFFKKINTYVFRQKKAFRPLTSLMTAIDRIAYRILPPVRKFSYLQIVEFIK